MEITIIIPVKDRRSHIGKTLDSILKSTVPPTEIIIVDNESTDGTYQFCEQYIKDRPNMTLLHETFPGSAAARNKGLKSCHTEWVYFFDSDDDFDRDFLALLDMLPTEDYDMVAVPTRQVVNGKEQVRFFQPSADPRIQILGSVLNTQGMVFRTSFLKDIGAWNTECRIWNDWELGLRAMLHQPQILWFPNHAFHTIHVHADSITGDNFSQSYKQLIRTLTAALNSLQSSILQPLSVYHAQHLGCIYPHLDLLMYPLYLRASILQGKMRNEQLTGKCKKYKMAPKYLRIFLHDHFQPTFTQRCVARLLSLYTLLGGRGAWRIALQVSQMKKVRKKR